MSVIHLHLDFETRSMLDIRSVGLDNYARSAEVLMMAWAVNDQEPQIWIPKQVTRCDDHGCVMSGHEHEFDLDCKCGGRWLLPEWDMPEQVGLMLTQPGAVKLAWNAAFERAILTHYLGINSPISQWIDPSVLARYAGMPGRLAKVSQFLKLGDKGKDKDGTRLINKFSKPFKGKFRDPADPKHALDWQKFQDYCRQDVVAEREIFHRLQKFFWPPAQELRLWELDAKINERGMPVSRDFVTNASAIVDAEMARMSAELKALTGLANPNSTAQLLPWLRERGYPFSSLGAKKVARAIDMDSERDKVTT